MESIKRFLRLGVCTVFVISLMYGLPACEKKEKPEQAEEKTQEMMEGSETRVLPEVQEKVEEAKEKVEEMAEEVKEEGQEVTEEVIEEGKEKIGEMEEMMEGSGAKMPEMEGSQPKE